jgi:hypothetical protein
MLTFADIAKQFLLLVSGDLDKYTTKKGVVRIDNKNQVSMFTPSHIQFAKYGRGPGKMPPVEPIIDWVEAKGIIKGDQTAEGTAWAIAKSISKKGTKNYVRNAPNAIEEAIQAHFNDYSNKLSKLTTFQINEEIVKIVEQNIPDQDLKI